VAEDRSNIDRMQRLRRRGGKRDRRKPCSAAPPRSEELMRRIRTLPTDGAPCATAGRM
jgi:hypothetical protein